MLEFSKRFLGLPYTWGGTSSFGYDCSGFAQMLCRRRGVPMPRDAQPQADWSGVAPVERKDLKPGDLLYFGSSAKKITHTGVYLGDGKFIDATTWQTPMVRIDDLNDAHWSRLLVAMQESEMNRRNFLKTAAVAPRWLRAGRGGAAGADASKPRSCG